MAAAIPFGNPKQPVGVAVSTNGSKVYIAHQARFLSVIDTATNSIIADILVGQAPRGVTVTPSKVYVANFFSNSVSVIDTATNKVIATIPVGNNPYGVSVTPDGSRVFVANSRSNIVSAIDAATNTAIRHNFR